MTLSETAASSATGAVISGRYRLGDLLGRGGMAEVYDGIDLRLQRPVAVKLLRQDMAARPDIRARFQAEAMAAAGLSDPGAVAVYDTGDHDGVPFLVMERLPGTTLADRIADGPVDPAWLTSVSHEVLGALDSAHRAGIVHRDVKPGNILLAPDGTAKITDFGIAKSFSPDDEPSAGDHDLTGTGQLLGTPAYLAPERLHGHRATPRSDLWAFGVVLYEALTGSKPFVGRTPLDVANAVVTGDHVPLGEARPGLDPTLVATVERAMALDPAVRFASAAEMAAALDGPPPDATAVFTPPPAALAARPRPVAVPGPRRSRKGLLWLLIVLFVALIVWLVGWSNRSTDVTRASASASATSATQATTPAQGLAARMRAFADQLKVDKDGARAGDLATGMRRVAGDVESGAPSAAGDATGQIISIGAWLQTGQLNQATAAQALTLLQQVPGVQAPAASTQTTQATTAATSPAVSSSNSSASSATNTAPPRRADNSNDNGKKDKPSKDGGKG